MRWWRAASAIRRRSACCSGGWSTGGAMKAHPAEIASSERQRGVFQSAIVRGPMDAITPQIVAAHGLSPEEYERIRSALGRDPNLVELGIFSAMWSEHCSYKSSRRFLRHLPTKGARVLQGPGENAGVVDVGSGLAVAFKMESHNHPSYI